MKFYIRRLLTLIITLLLVAAFTFIAFQVIPGDSALTKLGMEADEEAVEALRESLGLNDSLPVRFVRWLGGAVRGDFGMSTRYNMSVSELLSERLPVTLWLAVLSFLFILIITIPVGIISSKKRNGLLDRIIQWSSQTIMAIPPFFLGMLITLVFGILLKWFTPGAYVAPDESFGRFLAYLIAPAIAVSLPKIAMSVRFLRSSIIREKDMGYARTAKSKGLSENEVLKKHVLKNALIPVVTFLGMILADILAGSIIIEQVFNLPGMGRMLVVSISNRDIAVVQAIVMYIASVVLITNAIVDVLYKYLDPRVKMS